MSHSVIVPPVHETSPPPFDDEADDNDTLPSDDVLRSTSPDELNNSNDDWKSVEDNNDNDITEIQDDLAIVVDNEHLASNTDLPTEEDFPEEKNDEPWANFATFESEPDQISETLPPAPTSTVIEENTANDWADFETSVVPSSEEPMQLPTDEQPPAQAEEEEDDDFGEFSEVQVASKPPPSSTPTNTLTSEQIESLMSTCFPMESATDENSFISSELPSFTTFKDPTKRPSYLESSLSLWNVLSNISNDPVGIQFQWRKSNTERLFHQALGVNERFRTKNVPLTPEILQPEKVKTTNSMNNDMDNLDHENKLSNETIRPHFDWKQSGLENPLADNDSSSLSSNVSINKDTGFDANKSLDLDFYVPPIKSSHEDIESPVIQKNDSPIIPQQRTSIPIKTMDLFPGSTTTLNDDAKRIIDTLPNLSFMSAKALMFPVRFNSNNTNDEPTSLY